MSLGVAMLKKNAIGAIVRTSLLLFAGCSFNDSNDIILVQDATASENSSSSITWEDLSCSSKDDLSSACVKTVEPVALSSSFSPLSFDCGMIFEDSRDNARYYTIKIGTQCWFSKNLNYAEKNSACYDDQDQNCKKYGRLYRWSEAQSVCPQGSRLPSDDDWQTLFAYLGNAFVAARYLKDESSWSSAEDSFGFTALPAGYYSEDDEDFVQIEQMTIFWSATELGTDANSVVLRNSQTNIETWKYSKTNKMSVRCLMN